MSVRQRVRAMPVYLGVVRATGPLDGSAYDNPKGEDLCHAV